MASIYKHPKSGIFHVSFRFKGVQHGKSLRTRNKRKAEELAQATQRAGAAQGMEPMLMVKALGHADLKLIMSTYYAQRDDERLVSAASGIDFGVPALA